MKKVYAIANCRVSSDEQKLSGSLDRQGKSIELAAKELDVEILRTWSGSVSSKKGANVNRKDLEEMLELCKRDKRIKYVIIDELDRFMRSMLEIGYFLVLFNEVGVKIVFASQPNLRTDTAANTLLLMLEAFKAEGSNEERQRKSISGQTNALKEGRYTFCPKPGYMKGTKPGIHLMHPERGPALQRILKRLASYKLTPTQALIELNESPFVNNHAPYKMDKFEKIVADPYYAGIVEINKQVKVYNANGLHEPLITLDEHKTLVAIISKRIKYQVGPKRQGNPLFPMNNFIEHQECLDSKNGGRAVGFEHTNGKNLGRVYERYRCRTCGKLWMKNDLHQQVEDLFARYEMTEETQQDILDALDIVWRQNELSTAQEIRHVNHAISSLRADIKQQVENVTNPDFKHIRRDILAIIDDRKEELTQLEEKLEAITNTDHQDRREFMEFAMSFIQEAGKHFLDSNVSKENRLRFKQAVFPSGIMIDQKNKVYTPEISAFYRLVTKKKDAEASDNSHLVRVKGL